MTGRYLYPCPDMGHVFYLDDDGATLLASPMLATGAADMSEVVEVDWSRGVDPADLPTVERIRATLVALHRGDPGGHVRITDWGDA